MSIMTVEIVKVTDLSFEMAPFQPSRDLGDGWSFMKQVNGVEGNNGVTDFANAVKQAADMPPSEGRRLLFASGIEHGAKEPVNTRKQRIQLLAGRKLADPRLLWMLYKQKGQKVLRYLHNTYGVIHMEALRRTLTLTGGDEYFSYLRRDHKNGNWFHYLDDIETLGDGKKCVLTLG